MNEEKLQLKIARAAAIVAVVALLGSAVIWNTASAEALGDDEVIHGPIIGGQQLGGGYYYDPSPGSGATVMVPALEEALSAAPIYTLPAEEKMGLIYDTAGRCLAAEGQVVIVRTCQGDANEVWETVRESDDTYRFYLARDSSLSLTVTETSGLALFDDDSGYYTFGASVFSAGPAPGPPPVAVVSLQMPLTGATVDPSNITFRGSAQPNSEIVIKDFETGDILYRGQTLGNGDIDLNNIALQVLLTNGEHILVVEVAGETTQVTVTIRNRVVVSLQRPVLNPSNGNRISGTSPEGSTIAVKNSGGLMLCQSDIATDSSFSCVPNPRPGHGDEMFVTAFDQFGRTSPAVKVVINQKPPAKPTIEISNGKIVKGGVIAAENTMRLVDVNWNEIPGNLITDSQGYFAYIPDNELQTGQIVKVVVTDPIENWVESDVVVQAEVPSAPSVDPAADGSQLTGHADPESVVTVFDETGKVIGITRAKSDGQYKVALDPVQKSGSTLALVSTNQAGNRSERVTVRIGGILMVLKLPVTAAGTSQTAYAYGFQPGERVTVTLDSGSEALGTQIANADGNVVIPFTLPDQIALGDHWVTLSGPSGGSVRSAFSVGDVVTASSADPRALAATGGDQSGATVSGSLLMLGAGIALVAVVLRRKEPALG